jgi:hypothetical protein
VISVAPSQPDADAQRNDNDPIAIVFGPLDEVPVRAEFVG